MRILFPVAFVVIGLDQLAKWWAVEALGDGDIIDLFWTARFRLVRNDGAAFSIGTSITPVITVAAILVSVLVIFAARRARRPGVAAMMGLVLGGAIGNVIDRFLRPGEGFLRGAVIDYVDFQWWPVFNLADAAIVIGGIALVFLMSDDDLHRTHPRHALSADVMSPAHSLADPDGTHQSTSTTSAAS